mmetsp:Transcript_55251/g.89322  ORF Transcript_55251/g.89322 Transcript_55251/m.89322 type:complete len:120 (+) Transcript_55251:86-445(+)
MATVAIQTNETSLCLCVLCTSLKPATSKTTNCLYQFMVVGKWKVRIIIRRFLIQPELVRKTKQQQDELRLLQRSAAMSPAQPTSPRPPVKSPRSTSASPASHGSHNHTGNERCYVGDSG